MNYLELITRNIRELRLRNHLTQEQFAERISISTSGLRSIELMRHAPTATTINAICKAFKIEPFELLLSEKPSTATDTAILEKVKKLNAEQKAKLIKFIDADII